MPSYLKNEVILVRYPFSNFSGLKVRPAIVVNAPHNSQDVIIVPLTSKVSPFWQVSLCWPTGKQPD
jgi:mRNA interferase MazF